MHQKSLRLNTFNQIGYGINHHKKGYFVVRLDLCLNQSDVNTVLNKM